MIAVTPFVRSFCQLPQIIMQLVQALPFSDGVSVISSYWFRIFSSTVSWNTSTSVAANLRALMRFSNSTSSSANVRPRGSGRRKYV